MKKNFTNQLKTFSAAIFLLVCQLAFAQTNQSLSIKDFAIWGGSANATLYNKDQGVFLKGSGIINGNIGSNHMVDIKEGTQLIGNIYSGNGIEIKGNGEIRGNTG